MRRLAGLSRPFTAVQFARGRYNICKHYYGSSQDASSALARTSESCNPPNLVDLCRLSHTRQNPPSNRRALTQLVETITKTHATRTSKMRWHASCSVGPAEAAMSAPKHKTLTEREYHGRFATDCILREGRHWQV